jgi:hypothetical protein
MFELELPELYTVPGVLLYFSAVCLSVYIVGWFTNGSLSEKEQEE